MSYYAAGKFATANRGQYMHEFTMAETGGVPTGEGINRPNGNRSTPNVNHWRTTRKLDKAGKDRPAQRPRVDPRPTAGNGLEQPHDLHRRSKRTRKPTNRTASASSLHARWAKGTL